MCASPEYLEAHGIPQSPEALTQHRIILARGLNPVSEIRFQRDGTTQTIKLQAILSVSDNDSAASAALAGLGITRLLNYQIAGSLKSGQLKILLSEFEVASERWLRKIEHSAKWIDCSLTAWVTPMTWSMP